MRLRLPNTAADSANFLAVQLTLRLPDEATLVFTGASGATAHRPCVRSPDSSLTAWASGFLHGHRLCSATWLTLA